MAFKATKNDTPGVEAVNSASPFAIRPNAPKGRPTKCLSFQQPYASYIATGVKTAEFRSKKIKLPIRDLVVCSSKTMTRYPGGIAGLPYGMAIGMVDVVDCVRVKGEYAWKLENARMIKPFAVHATAGFFYVSNIPEIIPSTEEAYREHVLPLCFRGSTAEEDAIIASLFSAKSTVFRTREW